MNLKLIFAIIVSKVIMFILRVFRHGGTTLPGKTAIKIYPDIIKDITREFKIIMITGTNGKTTTVRIISQILKDSGINYITNRSGANLSGGIVSTFIEYVDICGRCTATTALLEIDEAAFPVISRFVKPDILIVTNFFRDQLDRYGELYSTLNGIKEGISSLEKVQLVLNADDSLCASLGIRNGHKSIYYGIAPDVYPSAGKAVNNDAAYCLYCKSKYDYSSHTYGHLGWFKCPDCGYRRPSSSITCTNIRELNSSYSLIDFSIGDNIDDNRIYNAQINLPGLYNIYNALASIACAQTLDLPIEKTIDSLSHFECGFGRMETIYTESKTIKVILVKNPTGFNQVINYLLTSEKNMQIAFLINDNLADGTDISWLWDVGFERLYDIQDKLDNIYTGGKRAEDMALRLKYSDIDTEKISVEKDYNNLIDTALSRTNIEHSFYILPTYTAMLEIRKVLKNRFGLKDFWK